MIYESSDEFITNRAWLKSAVGDKNMILHLVSFSDFKPILTAFRNKCCQCVVNFAVTNSGQLRLWRLFVIF